MGNYGSPRRWRKSSSDDERSKLVECISLFKSVNKNGIDKLIEVMKTILETLENKPGENLPNRSSETPPDSRGESSPSSVRTSFLQGGAAFIEFLSKHIQKGAEKEDFVSQFGGERSRQAVAEILQIVGKMHWVVGGLSILAFLLGQIDQLSENRSECIELLRQMVKLAYHIKDLNCNMPQEEKNLREAITLIVEGSMMCASQLKSNKLFRFLKASVNSQSLSSLQSRINELYPDLNLKVFTEIQHRLPIVPPPSQPIYPEHAVGIKERGNQVTALLYGLGGIVKSTLATAVIAKLDLKDYNYTAVEMQEDPSKNDLKCIQQQS